MAAAESVPSYQINILTGSEAEALLRTSHHHPQSLEMGLASEAPAEKHSLQTVSARSWVHCIQPPDGQHTGNPCLIVSFDPALLTEAEL